MLPGQIKAQKKTPNIKTS
jgi:hypothetical protein